MPPARTLSFMNAASSAAIWTAEGINVVDLHGDRPPVLHPIEDVIDFLEVGSELWVAAGQPPELSQYGTDHALRARRPLEGARGMLRPCTIGVAGAAWSEPPHAVLLADGRASTMT